MSVITNYTFCTNLLTIYYLGNLYQILYKYTYLVGTSILNIIVPIPYLFNLLTP